jgi:hypothetical protein
MQHIQIKTPYKLNRLVYKHIIGKENTHNSCITLERKEYLKIPKAINNNQKKPEFFKSENFHILKS